MFCQESAISGYLAFFLMLIFTLLLLLSGVVALRAIRPGKRGRGRAWFCLIMGAMFLLLLLIGVIASLGE